MTETTEKPSNWLKKPVSRRTVLKTAAGLAIGAAAFSSVGAENKNKTPNVIPQEATQDTTAKQEKTPDKILSPQETDAKIQEFIPKIDSLFSGVQITRPTEFPDTHIIRPNDPKIFPNDKISPSFQTAISEEAYLTADGVKNMALNSNATGKPIIVRGIEYTANDPYYIRHVKENWIGVAFGIKLLAEQTHSPEAIFALTQVREIHIGMMERFRVKEPQMALQPEIDYYDKHYYQILQQ